MNQQNIKPLVYVLSGVPLSGKSYLAKQLSETFSLTHIDVDDIRQSLDESRQDGGPVGFLEPDQELNIMVRSYTELCRQGIELAMQGESVILTGTFSRAVFKEPLKTFIEQNIPMEVFLLTVPDEQVEKRIAFRRAEGSFSNIDTLDKFKWAQGIFQEIDFAPVIRINTADPVEVKAVFDRLRRYTATSR